MISRRIQNIWDISYNVTELQKYIPIQKITYTPDESKNPMLRHAEAFVAVMRQAHVNHLPGSRLAGNGGIKFADRPDHILPEEYREMERYIQEINPTALAAMKEKFFFVWGFSDGHVIPDYPLILREGVAGVLRKLYARKDDAGLSTGQKEFLQASIMQWESVLEYAARHRSFYQRLAENEKNPALKAEYQATSDWLQVVPENPATTFSEALQSVWFTHLCCQYDDIDDHSIGRLDQYLEPYYTRDIQRGILTHEEAEDLFYEFWLKFMPGYRITEEYHIPAGAKGSGITADDLDNGLALLQSPHVNKIHFDLGQTIDICGRAEDDSDCTNPISWLVLECVNKFRTYEPKVVLNAVENTDEDILEYAMDILGDGHGIPAIAFQKQSEQAMLNHALFEEEDVRGYGHIGCIELGIPGKSYVDPMNAFINLPKIVLAAMDCGQGFAHPVGAVLPRPNDFDDFLGCFKKQLDYFIGLYVDTMNQVGPFYSRFYSRPLISAVTEGCIEKATPIDCGGAKYSVKAINGVGLATAIDSLYAIKEVVYEQKLVTLYELREILKDDFAGQESIRLYLRNKIAKYGNGNSEVDYLAEIIVQTYANSISTRKTWFDTPYRPGLYGFYEPIKKEGAATGATPNGRRAGVPLSLGIAPEHGCVENGVSAVLESVTSFDHRLADNGVPIDIMLDPQMGKKTIRYIHEYLIDKNVLYSQYTMVKLEDLLAAQNDPEKYSDLTVRVTGFSARFVSLDRGTQNEIIKRSYWGH